MLHFDRPRLILGLIFTALFPFCCFSAEDIILIADEISYSENGSILSATGDVTVEYKNYTLTTPRLTYNKTTGAIVAVKPIQLRSGEKLSIIADAAEINDQFMKIIAQKARAVIENQFKVI